MNTIARIAIVAAGLALGVVGCSKSPSNGGDSQASEAPANGRDDVYEDVLGFITKLPVAGQPGTELKIYHEHLPHFRTKDGTVFVRPDGVPGMAAMDMPFPPAEGLDLSGLEIGDPVRFTFVVRYSGSGPAWEVTKIEELPAGTEIDLANKVTEVPAADDHTGHDHDHHGHDHDHSGHDHDSP